MDAEKKTFWCCSKCGSLNSSEAAAEACCGPKPCERCGVGELYNPYTVCKNCLDLIDQERERVRFEKAEKVPEAQWDGPVFSEDCCSEDEGYARSTDEMMQSVVDSFGELSFEDTEEAQKARGDQESEFDWACRFIPEYVWACDVLLPHIDAENVIERLCEDAHEGAYDSIVGYADLQKVLDEWCARQTFASWDCNYKKAVVIDRAYWIEELKKECET